MLCGDGCFKAEDVYGVIFLFLTVVCLGVVLWSFWHFRDK